MRIKLYNKIGEDNLEVKTVKIEGEGKGKVEMAFKMLSWETTHN